MRTTLALALAAGAIGLLGTAAAAEAGGCPSAGTWTRVGDVPAGTTSVAVTAPAGGGIVETCVWTGTEAQLFAYDPAASSVVLAPVGVPAEGEPALAVVEYAYRVITLEPVPAPAPTPEPTSTPAPEPSTPPAPVPAPQPAVAPVAARPAASSSRPAAAVPAPATTAAPATAVAEQAPTTLAEPVESASPEPEPEVSVVHASASVRAPASTVGSTAEGTPGHGLAVALGVLTLLGGGAAGVVLSRRRAMGITPAGTASA